ncbi:dipeptidase [Chloroflexota bacterium]
MPTAHEFVQENRDRFIAQLDELLRIPSVSTLPEHAVDVARAADWLIADMQRIGLPKAEIHRAEGYLPLVYGEWTGAGPDAPTMLVYCHYDVQPAAIADGWTSDPFVPVERDGKLYARGAVDSKSHVLAWLKATEALLAAAEGCPVNIKLLFEGEEESGSEHIFEFVAHNKEKLAADVIVISDGSMPAENQPALEYGLRGIVSMELIVTGPQRDLHSGHYGGSIHNPLQALAEILTGLHNADGSVAVAGFYDNVQPLDEAERATLAEIAPWIEEEWQTVTGAPAPWGEPDYAINERIGARPTLEINGMAGGFYGEGFKTVIPAQALAKISCRLVPDQDPARIYTLVEEHIAAHTPPTVTAELTQLDAGARGILLDRDAPAMQAARHAYEQSWGVPPILSRAGGSVPVVDAFQAELDTPLVMLPFGVKAGGAHGPNEFVVLDMFAKGISAALYFAYALAKS